MYPVSSLHRSEDQEITTQKDAYLLSWIQYFKTAFLGRKLAKGYDNQSLQDRLLENSVKEKRVWAGPWKMGRFTECWYCKLMRKSLQMTKEAVVMGLTVHILQMIELQKLCFDPKVVRTQQLVYYWQRSPRRQHGQRLLLQTAGWNAITWNGIWPGQLLLI